jgi:hypothetical protein
MGSNASGGWRGYARATDRGCQERGRRGRIRTRREWLRIVRRAVRTADCAGLAERHRLIQGLGLRWRSMIRSNSARCFITGASALRVQAPSPGLHANIAGTTVSAQRSLMQRWSRNLARSVSTAARSSIPRSDAAPTSPRSTRRVIEAHAPSLAASPTLTPGGVGVGVAAGVGVGEGGSVHAGGRVRSASAGSHRSDRTGAQRFGDGFADIARTVLPRSVTVNSVPFVARLRATARERPDPTRIASRAAFFASHPSGGCSSLVPREHRQPERRKKTMRVPSRRR